ncbi:MAG: Telomerase protein component 1 [Cirrosporium novae-zelandiae]|nr:MAG: Telomerase protein component 1 [Cirrosporium novae-zelandiae]
MASLLRQIVAGPRCRHPEARLDLCYMTDNIVVTSGPSSTYPQRAYRNPTDALVKFLDSKHGENWAIWEFRAEGTGYPDSEVYDRIHHYPWPDHHPPPFAIIPNVMASMRNWLKDEKAENRVVVVHCKAGKGRSGTVATSYLISEEGWDMDEALKRFTDRRMRPGFGPGVSIPSQLRWVGYVDRWTKHGKKYIERPVEILELHVWGLRDGVKIAVEGYVDQGRKIQTFHVFSKKEREIIDAGPGKRASALADDIVSATQDASSPPKYTSPTQVTNVASSSTSSASTSADPAASNPPPDIPTLSSTSTPASTSSSSPTATPTRTTTTGLTCIFRPTTPLTLPTSDINLTFERRARATYNWTLITSIAHVWFNAYFEGQGPEKNGQPETSGVFEIPWEALDGIKGSGRKGTRAFERVMVVWMVRPEAKGEEVREPAVGETVVESGAVDWAGGEDRSRGRGFEGGVEGKLGLRMQTPEDGPSRESSVERTGETTDTEAAIEADEESDSEKVVARLDAGEDEMLNGNDGGENAGKGEGGKGGKGGIKNIGLAAVAGIVKGLRGDRDAGVSSPSSSSSSPGPGPLLPSSPSEKPSTENENTQNQDKGKGKEK